MGAAAETDASLASLQRFAQEADWVVRQAVPVFDEHDEYTPEVLAEIAANCNRREATTGDVCPITLGHTLPGQSEDKQPATVGYARKFRVGKYGPAAKTGILSDFWFMKDKFDEAMTYPRRSVELWPEERFFDPISLLRRTPRRDLGLLTFQKGPRQGRKLRYAMEDTLGDTVPYGGEPGPAPVGGGLEQYEPLLRMLMQMFGGQLAGPEFNQAGAPGAGNGSLLGDTRRTPMSDQHAAPTEAVVKMQKDLETQASAFQKLQKDHADLAEQYRKDREASAAEHTALKTRLQEEAAARQEWEKKYYRKEREARLQKRLDEGYVFDLAEELADHENDTPEQFAKFVDSKIPKSFKKERPPIHDGLPIPAILGEAGVNGQTDPMTGRPKELSREDSARVVQYALDKGLTGSDAYAKARRELFPNG